MTYDSLSRVLTEVQSGDPIPTAAKTVSFSWDAGGNRTPVAYPSGFDTREIRGVRGQFTRIEAEVAEAGSEAYVTKLDDDTDEVLDLTAYKVTPYGGSSTTTSFTTNPMNEFAAVGGVTVTGTDAGSRAGDGTKLCQERAPSAPRTGRCSWGANHDPLVASAEYPQAIADVPDCRASQERIQSGVHP